MPSYTLQQLADKLGAKLHGDASVIVSALKQIDQAGEGDISFLSDAKYAEFLKLSKASALVLTEEMLPRFNGNVLVMENPYLGFALLAQLFEVKHTVATGVHSTAVVADSAQLADDVCVAAGVVIGENVRIGKGCVIKANTVLEDGVVLGENCTLHANVTIYHGCQLGDRVIVHSGAVIGADGFGMAKDAAGAWVKIPQLGCVIVGSDVEIGACTTIDRGALDNTVIADNVKLDNQIQVAHNTKIGHGTAIAACTGIAGSTKIGKNCLIGGAVGIAGHLSIADNVMLTAQSGVSKSLKEAGVYSSTIAVMPVKKWLKNTVHLRNLDALVKRVKKLEQEIK